MSSINTPATAANAVPSGAGIRVPPKRRGYAGRTSEQLAEERRHRLLEAALALFAERGFSRTPIEMLCSTARVTTRHFYEHFESREAVLVALYDRIMLDTRRVVAEALQQRNLSPRERLDAAIRAFVEGSTADPRRTRILCVEVIGVSSEMFERRRASVHEFAGLLNSFTRALVSAGELPDRDYLRTCIGMVGAIRELMTEWLISEDRAPIESVHSHLISLFSCLLAGARELDAAGKL
ncbi:TetR/AcrR family transcriptional regulator [Nevskia sp.]|uniref:TetR/AcrR family transcriptional regulator n=1 Tax=Nevskia sp. TaxID=1929292 RepID=UPI0025D1CD81|nr:TetR/AcrR family transcriptional regulator [Nevskia sp.]